MVEQLNSIACLWWEWSAAMFWQVGLLILVIAAIDRLIRRWAWPQLRYALWSLILIKLLLPPSLSLPSGVVPSVAPIVKQGLARLQTQKPPVAEGRALFLLSEDMFSVRSVPVRAYQETPYGVTTSEFLGESVEVPSSVLRRPSSVPVVWQVYAMMASLAGTLILGIWLFLRLHSLVGRRAQETAAASLPQSFYNQLAGCARRLELSCIPRVVVTRRLATPAVFGMFRPVLLMPKGYLGKLSRRDTEHMLLHELAHIKRGDLIAHGLYMLLQVAYWYNPLLWLVRRQVHHLRELSCDATVAELLREQTTAYRQTLLETARRLLTSSVEPGVGLLGLFEDSNRLLVRLNWLTKPTWRYRTMKRVTVAVVAALMLACVLPMARAQEAAPNPPSPAVVREGVEGVPPSNRGQDVRDTYDQGSREIAALKAQLETLMAQQQQLQEQMRAMTEKRGQPAGPAKLKHADSSVSVQLQKKKGVEQSNVTVVPWQDEEHAGDATTELRHTREPAMQARQERSKAMDEARRAEVEAQRAKAESLRAAAEGERVEAEAKRREEMAKHFQKMYEQMGQRGQSGQMKSWQEQIHKWESSDEMKRWQQQMEEWGKKMERWGQEMGRRHEQDGEGSADVAQVPEAGSMPAMPPMPAMPVMPPMPDMPPVSVNVHVPQPVPSPHPVPHVEEVPMTPVAPEAPQKEANAEQVVPCGDLMVKSLPDGATLVVENNVGNVVIEGGKERDCTIKATARIKGVDREEAERIAKNIVVQVTPADGRVRVAVRLPEGLKDEQKNKIAVDLRIVAPGDVNVQARQKVGNVKLANLQGKVTALVDVGAVETWNLQGDVAIRTNVGNIDFATSRDLSAKIQAQAQVGSISSNLPLEITGAAMTKSGNAQTALGSHATGTLGQGKSKIDLNANVGSIQIRGKETPEKREVF
jgi:beta-lactamase regulating signal transducer with metallopeptidase domain